MKEQAKRRRNRVEWNSTRVRALRQHLGMTQEEFSAELGTRQQTISEWELGKYKPRGPSSRLLTILAERAGFKYGESPEAEQPIQPTTQPETS